MLHFLGGNMHVVAVCQPSVPVMAAVSVMEAAHDPFVPLSMTLMGGPIDTRRNPTAVNNLAAENAASTGSATTSSPRCRFRIRA